MKTCPGCGCQNAPLGALGNLNHYRCAACGVMYTGKARRKKASTQ